MDYGLGDFGDARLKKGAHFYIAVWLKLVSAALLFARSAAIEPVKYA